MGVGALSAEVAVDTALLQPLPVRQLLAFINVSCRKAKRWYCSELLEFGYTPADLAIRQQASKIPTAQRYVLHCSNGNSELMR